MQAPGGWCSDVRKRSGPARFTYSYAGIDAIYAMRPGDLNLLLHFDALMTISTP
jgi:hypothetical protein